MKRLSEKMAFFCFCIFVLATPWRGPTSKMAICRDMPWHVPTWQSNIFCISDVINNCW